MSLVNLHEALVTEWAKPQKDVTAVSKKLDDIDKLLQTDEGIAQLRATDAEALRRKLANVKCFSYIDCSQVMYSRFPRSSLCARATLSCSTVHCANCWLIIRLREFFFSILSIDVCDMQQECVAAEEHDDRSRLDEQAGIWQAERVSSGLLGFLPT